jgi:hypothetical protein
MLLNFEKSEQVNDLANDFFDEVCVKGSPVLSESLHFALI